MKVCSQPMMCLDSHHAPMKGWLDSVTTMVRKPYHVTNAGLPRRVEHLARLIRLQLLDRCIGLS
jgi:hypothetical protein